jgi:hypothetical protein
MQIDTTAPTYDQPKTFARGQHKKGLLWDEIKKFKTSNCKNTHEWLKGKVEEDWPLELTEHPNLWGHLIDELKDAWDHAETQKEIDYIGAESAGLTESIDPRFTIPTEKSSAWQKYRTSLTEGGFPEQTVSSIEEECFKTLQCLKMGNVEEGKDIKGLVIGHVQSGKTANMAGLMAMAADWGFNMFIVLTGTIDSLRKQTQTRLFNDLSQEGSTQDWHSLTHLNKNMEGGEQSVGKTFNNKNNYLTVSLKNKSRLTNLKEWLQEHPNKLKQMNILLIDDEADQASINTKKAADDRTAINQCIIDLTKLGAKTMNYIAYTATPYANILNEPGGINSLYPHSFIRALPLSPSYFGPELIFGALGINRADESSDLPRLDILREIPTEDVSRIKELQDGESDESADSLMDSLAWFLCASAVRRESKSTSPSSMLIHTSQIQAHHKSIAKHLEHLLSQKEMLIKRCEQLYKEETKRLSLTAFNEQYPDYVGSPSDYPKWKNLTKHIDELLGKLEHIRLDKGGFSYHKGLHLCIDNCSNNGFDDEGNFKRLLYPDPKKQQLDYSPAFIVIGGATLSRGLTIEGLVSTYFLRTTRMGDSLMQMGRWFGYRKGYELLPRIWMTTNSMDQFEYLATIEAELREEIKIYEKAGVTPSKFGPKVSSWAPAAFLSITAKNKMKGAVAATWDFSGISNETVIFSENTNILNENIKTTTKFLSTLLGAPDTPKGKGLVYREIEFKIIAKYLKSMKFHPRSKVFKNIKLFIDWFKQVNQPEAGKTNYCNWNVIVSSLSGMGDWKEEDAERTSNWEVAGKRLIKVNRSRLVGKRVQVKGELSIGALQDPLDKFLDLPVDAQPSKAQKGAEAFEIREAAGLGDIPQLIIYRVDGGGEPKNLKKSAERTPLNLKADIIGLLLRVPGKPNNENTARQIQVSIPKDAYTDDIDITGAEL